MKKMITHLSILSLSALLVACSGGGGGNGGNNNNSTTAASIQVVPEALVQENVPTNENQTNNSNSSSQKLPIIMQPESKPELSQTVNKWIGECYSASICEQTDEVSSSITVYKLTLQQNATPANSVTDKLNSKKEHIALILGENKSDEYSFTLLGSDNNQVSYYGYRHVVGSLPDKRQIELLYAVNPTFKSKEQKPTELKAYYKKDKGFLYSPINPSTNNIKSYGDVDLIYYEGSINGSIYSTDGNKREIFNISTSHNSTVIEPKEELQATIKSGDKAALNYILVNADKNQQDYKYLFASAKAETWIGVLAAERQADVPTTPKHK